MNSKTIFQLVFLSVVSASITACQFEDEDFFDESASLRVEHTINTVQDILVKPSNGWVMQYFCGDGVAHFEGFNLFAKFEKNMKVTLAGNHRYLRNGNAGNYYEHSSIYSLLLEDGPVLALNTWNDVLSPFVDPVDPGLAPSNLIKDGAGMQGDNNFVVLSYNNNEVLLRGERYGAEIRLVASDRMWKDYISACDSMKKSISSTTLTSYYLTNEKDTIFLSGINGGRVRKSERLVNPLRNDSLSCVFTPLGIRFEKKDSLGDDEFQEFFLNADTTYLQSKDGKVKVIACWDRYISDCSANWRLDPSAFTAEQNALYQQLEAEVKKANANFVLDSVMIGVSAETMSDNTRQLFPGLILAVHGPAKMGRIPRYTPYVNMEIARPGFGMMMLAKSTEDRTNSYMEMFSATNFKALGEQFAATLFGTYEIEPNDFFRPTLATLKPTGTGNVVKLRLQAIQD